MLHDTSTTTPQPIPLDEPLFDIAMHPSETLIASASISGQVYCHNYTTGHKLFQKLPHSDSCRSLVFHTSNQIGSVSTDRSLSLLDVETGKLRLRKPKAHSDAINVVRSLSEDLMATGDDGGCVKIWDLRQRRCTHTFTEHTDFISDMILGNGSTNGEGHTLLVSGGDGILSVLDLRSTGGRKLLGKSAFQEDELQSLCLVRGGTKVCVGTQSGTILIFSYGQWGDHTDRFPGHPESISTLATDGQRRLFTGDDAGVIRECSVMPHSVQRTIGKHRHVVSTDENGCIAKEDKGDLPAVERLCLSGNGEFLASCSTQGSIRFWSTSTASVASSDKNKDRNNDDSDTEDDEEEEVERRRPKKVKLKQAFKKSDQRGAHSDFFSDLA